MGMYDSLRNPGQLGQNALLAFQQGRELRIKEKSRNALNALISPPPNVGQPTPGIGVGIPGNDTMGGPAPNVTIDPRLSPGGGIGGGHIPWGDLTPEDRQAAMSFLRFNQEQKVAQQKQQQEQAAAQLRMKAAQGDAGALQQLVGIDFDSWKSLDGSLKQKVKAQNDYIGQAALRISQLDPQAQPAAWDQAIAQGVQAGYTDLQKYAGQYSPQALQGAIDNAGLVEKFISLAEPKYLSIPAGGTLVDTRNPQAVQSFQAGAPEAIREGATATNPQTGEKIQFRNGQWVPVGGGSGNATGGFRP